MSSPNFLFSIYCFYPIVCSLLLLFYCYSLSVFSLSHPSLAIELFILTRNLNFSLGTHPCLVVLSLYSPPPTHGGTKWCKEERNYANIQVSGSCDAVHRRVLCHQLCVPPRLLWRSKIYTLVAPTNAPKLNRSVMQMLKRTDGNPLYRRHFGGLLQTVFHSLTLYCSVCVRPYAARRVIWSFN